MRSARGSVTFFTVAPDARTGSYSVTRSSAIGRHMLTVAVGDRITPAELVRMLDVLRARATVFGASLDNQR